MTYILPSRINFYIHLDELIIDCVACDRVMLPTHGIAILHTQWQQVSYHTSPYSRRLPVVVIVSVYMRYKYRITIENKYKLKELLEKE